jgi:4-carboxymuconolactone decarboxylase
MDLAEERRARIEKALQRLGRFDASWAEMFREYVLDGMYERNVIDQKTRELCAVSALTVLDRPGPLKDHIKGAIRNGAAVQEVIEVIAQSSVYGGFPTALAALVHLEAVLEELGLTDQLGPASS